MNSQNYQTLLENQLFGEGDDQDLQCLSEKDFVDNINNFSTHSNIINYGIGANDGSKRKKKNVLRFKAEHKQKKNKENAFKAPIENDYSQNLKPTRKVPKLPFKVLDAPQLKDDFYLNLLDWSSQNILAVGLGTAVYIWSACNSQVTKLCEFEPDKPITSVCWS